jgi:hypothetical protein
VSDGQLRRYIAKSDEALAVAVEKDRAKLFAKHLARRELVYAKCVEVGDFKGALACLKDQAELENMYPPAKHQHGADQDNPWRIQIIQGVDGDVISGRKPESARQP